MSDLSLQRLAKTYDGHQAVRDVNLTIGEGEFVSLLGPSGCGKTTILRMVAGLITPTGGSIQIGGRDVTALPPNKRNIGLVFQSYALFPHMTVFENVAFGLRRKKERGSELESRVNEALALVRLDGYAERYPRQLSGGQQQRVAMARAIAPRPSLLLFDEPLSNLDAKLRDEMQIELKRLQRDLTITTLFVTHDQTEALSLSDRVCVMHDGIIQQYDTPEEVYRRPKTAFVASFIGKPNQLSGVVKGQSVEISDGVVLKPSSLDAKNGQTVDVFIRQEAVSLLAKGNMSSDAVAATIALRSFSGAQIQYVVRLSNGSELVVEAPSAASATNFEPGDTVGLDIRPDDMIVLPREG